MVRCFCPNFVARRWLAGFGQLVHGGYDGVGGDRWFTLEDGSSGVSRWLILAKQLGLREMLLHDWDDGCKA